MASGHWGKPGVRSISATQEKRPKRANGRMIGSRQFWQHRNTTYSWLGVAQLETSGWSSQQKQTQKAWTPCSTHTHTKPTAPRLCSLMGSHWARLGCKGRKQAIWAASPIPTWATTHFWVSGTSNFSICFFFPQRKTKQAPLHKVPFRVLVRLQSTMASCRGKRLYIMLVLDH